MATLLPWASVEYALDWPRELLRAELTALINHPYRACTAAEIELLLREAFHTSAPADDFARLSSADEVMRVTVNLQTGTTSGPDPVRAPGWLTGLVNHLDEVRQYASSAPLWRTRRALHGRRLSVEPKDARLAFAMLTQRLYADGYLARELGALCIDAEQDEHGQLPHNGRNSQNRILEELQRRLGTAERGLWPPAWDHWDTDTFYELIEAWHDLVARPRRRWIHDHDECGVHFEDFDPDAGRRIYRALVNRLLAEYDVSLQLAADGEDEGRLVQLVDDARGDLLQRAMTGSTANVADRIAHAITQFRRRGAAEQDKISAVITLAGILEERRELVREQLGRKDEGALFTIANEFAIRHQRRGQQGDYDPAFLDWIFWWYLATVELTERLLVRQLDGEANA